MWENGYILKITLYWFRFVGEDVIVFYYISFFNSLINAGHIAIIINKNGSDAAIEMVCKGFRLPAASNKNAIAASMTAHIISLYFGGLIFPSLVITLSE